MPGTLYLCGTPIGNLEDMTFRAVRVLREVKAIAAEDTRRTRKLLAHFDIKTPLVSYHEHNKEERGPALLARLAAGEDIAVVSDAGMPGIADPGADLVRQAVAAGVPVVPVVGANAALAAVVASGLDTGIIHFLGFLPRTAKRRRDVLAVAAAWPGTLVLYEAPHRLLATLAELAAALGDRPAVAAREVSKIYEEFVRGSLSSLQAHFAAAPPRGEFTLVVGGRPDDAPAAAPPPQTGDLAASVAALMTAGMSKKDAIKRVAEERKVPKRVVYQAAHSAAGRQDAGGRSPEAE